MTDILLTATDEPLQRRLRQALRGAGPTMRTLPGDDAARDADTLLRRIEAEPAAEVVLLGPAVDLATALTVSTELDRRHPWASIVLVADPAPSLWADAMRAGVREILAPDAGRADIRAAFTRAGQAAQLRRPSPASVADDGDAGPSRLITVASPKGGTGKTTVATNLAVGLGGLAPLQTVLVDLDLQFGDVATVLQLQPEHTLEEAVRAPAVDDTLVLKSYLSQHPAGFYTLCAPESPAVADTVAADGVSRLLQQLTSQFRYVVVDTAPGLGEHALAALDQATDQVMLCGLDLPGVLGLRKELGILTQLDLVPQTRHVVLNFAHRSRGLSARDVEATIGVPVDVVLPHSNAVPLSTNRGVPLLSEPTRDPAVKGLRGLVQRFDPARAPKSERAHRGLVVR